ncbi:MAG TPA: DUF2569 domain-containing protein [Terracidiphilus sp.]|nr:DUF2569 domain-containing protein [Terracidiphilus sp.]
MVPASPVAAASMALDGAATAGMALDPAANLLPEANQKNLQGIGGWLTLVAIGLALGPFGLLLAVGGSMMLLFSPAGAAVLAANPGVGGLLALDAAIDALFILALVYLNFHFYGKKKTFPRLAMGYLAASFVLQIAMQRLMVQYMPTFPSWTALSSLISAGVWIPYFLLSQRVKQTFVN